MIRNASTHDMYLTRKRAPAREIPPKSIADDLPPHGDREAREAWMRERQAQKKKKRGKAG